MNRSITPTFLILLACVPCLYAAQDLPNPYTNSIGMKFVRIEPGEFQMGQLQKPLPSDVLPVFRGRGLFDALKNGDYDESPLHKVKITKPYYVAVCEVTNFQYELFQPEHRTLRGKKGFSSADDEAVVFVNWYDAMAFCKWLSDKEALPYRLPTEAEWEYACRAGTTTNYHTGDVLPDTFVKLPAGKKPQVLLTVGRTPANAWGIYDMHGNVEEWCADWYGQYPDGPQADPVGHITGNFRVTRGASRDSEIYYMRSANRMAAIPETRNWVTGFRVIIGQMPKTKPLTVTPPQNQLDVVRRPLSVVTKGPDPDKPYFKGPLRYVNIATSANGPTYSCHNHDPAIAECPNGDLLAIWYTCHDEHGRELAQAASRLRPGQKQWEEASLFFYTPDRNNHAPALGYDDKTGMLFHFTGVSAAKSRSLSAIAMRTSKDSGKTWSAPRLIQPEFQEGHLPSEPFFRTLDDQLVFAIDGPNTLFMSRDDGKTWYNPGGDIPGIHSGVTQLSDGRLFAFSRGFAVKGTLPISISSDGGKSFTQQASDFAPVGGGQRLALMKLRSGELFLASFTSEKGPGMEIKDASGKTRYVKGLFAALSADDGKTWPCKRLITDDGPARTIECTDGAAITMSARNSEYRGYLSACQSLDGLINVISSRNHFAFNLKWLKTLPPAASDEAVHLKPAIETFTGPDKFDLADWHDYKGSCITKFTGQGTYLIDSGSHYNGINRLIGKGSFEATFAVKNIRYHPQGPKISEGVTLGFRDPIAEEGVTMFIWLRLNELAGRETESVKLSEPAKSAKIKFIYNDTARCWHVFYGLNGDEPVTEIGTQKDGICVKAPTSESLGAYILVSNCSVELDNFEIKPL